MTAHFLFPDVIAAAQMLIRHRVVTFMVFPAPVLRTASRRDEWTDFFPQSRIMTVAGVISTVSRSHPDFPVGLVYQTRQGLRIRRAAER